MSDRSALVWGTGPGGLAAATDLALAGYDVAVTDLEGRQERLASLADGVTIAGRAEPVALRAVSDTAQALAAASLILVAVPAVAHGTVARRVLSGARQGATVVFIGDGGGALAAHAVREELGRHDLRVGETNCLPVIARDAGPAAITVQRKTGGVLVATLPPHSVADVVSELGSWWSGVEAAESVWATALINYDAIDIAPVAVTNAAVLERQPDRVLFWGAGASPAVVRLIQAVDQELIALRAALGHHDRRGYADFLVAQGLTGPASSLYEQMRGSPLMNSVRPSGGPQQLVDRLIDIPGTYVLASQLGTLLDTPTPAIDGLIAVHDALTGSSAHDTGRTLASLALDGLGPADLRRLAGLPDRTEPAPDTDTTSNVFSQRS